MTRLPQIAPRWLTHRRARARIMDDIAHWLIGEPENDAWPTAQDCRDAAVVWCLTMFAFALGLATAVIGGWM